MENSENFENKTEFMTVMENEFSQKSLDDILFLESKCYSKEMQYDEEVAREYYGEALKNIENINIFLKEDVEVIGYVLAVFHNKGFDEISGYDPGFVKQENVFYVETIQVLPEKSGRGGAKKLLLAVCEEAKKRGIDKFSIHARKTNGLSDIVKRIFDGKIITVREIESWIPACGEPYEYIEWGLEKWNDNFSQKEKHLAL